MNFENAMGFLANKPFSKNLRQTAASLAAIPLENQGVPYLPAVGCTL